MTSKEYQEKRDTILENFIQQSNGFEYVDDVGKKLDTLFLELIGEDVKPHRHESGHLNGAGEFDNAQNHLRDELKSVIQGDKS